MMYCPRCNNTYWVRSRPRDVSERLAILRLKRPYRCTKCGRMRLGSIFLDFKWFGPRKPKRKFVRDKGSASSLTCPECGSGVRRSRRRALERVLFFLKAYRCVDCRARFWTLKL
jgi:uncharacterized protein with PIN domain